MKRPPSSTPVLQGAPGILGISRPVSVPLIQLLFPPSTGDQALPSRGLPASLLSVFSVPVSWARGIRIRGPPLSSPACPASSDLCAVFGFFPPSCRSAAIMRSERPPFCVRAAPSVLRSSRALEHRTTTPLLRGLPRSFSVSSLLRVGPIRARFPSGLQRGPEHL
ncbi:hypothetical protein NDU88_007721 [Pleurodeles waltl]|uniref:Uncharacterized protein n=1 Tax=Pleurodeles waltl TaxID=8319 RepID=A0AAV7N4G8_PLEWA|nr:hypothetical protein NDU88_007721 [Pleurodeles waltl]